MSQASIQERTAQEESELLDRLRAGDERACEALVARSYPTMLAVAQHHVRTRAVAEEVVQEAWLGVLEGLDRFEGPLLAEDLDPAHPHGKSRTVPYSALVPAGEEPALEPERFRSTDDPFPGHGARTPATGPALEYQSCRTALRLPGN